MEWTEAVTPTGSKPLVLVTMGDPAGIGPEVALKAALAPRVRRALRPVLLAAPSIVRRTAKRLGLPVTARILQRPEGGGRGRGVIDVLPIQAECPRFRMGRACPDLGPMVLAMLRQAADLAMAGHVDAVTTAPICKEAVEPSWPGFAGHTEYMAEITGAREFCMMLSSDRLRVTFVTTHCAIRWVTKYLTAKRLRSVVRLTHAAMKNLGIARPRVAVAALNPHAGESGLFGDEEQRVIGPTVRALRRRLPNLTGPHPADVLFHAAYRGHHDAVVCMYHDQGHVPLKMIAFDQGVNTTLGLPIVRTSPDHGTAFDIAGKGIANPGSMEAALLMAAGLARRRQANPHRKTDTP